MKNKRSPRGLLMVVAAFLAVAQVGCDSVVDPDDHAAGVVFVRADGSEAARFVYQGAITGSLAVPVGASATYRVRVLTEAGSLIDLDGVEYSIGSTTIVNGILAGGVVQGEDQIVLTGLTAGNTTLRFPLEHGEHAEFEVRDVAVTVLNE